MNVKIADFGLARPLTAFGSCECTTVNIGTTRFMAPEFFIPGGLIGTAVDIWALGCVLIELFSGKRPWFYISKKNTSSIIGEMVNRRPIPIPDTVDVVIRGIIQECCRYNPNRRPNVLDILERLSAIL